MALRNTAVQDMMTTPHPCRTHVASHKNCSLALNKSFSDGVEYCMRCSMAGRPLQATGPMMLYMRLTNRLTLRLVFERKLER